MSKRTLKVFCSKDEQKGLAKSYKVLEHYDGFALLEADAAGAAKLAQQYPVEDISGQFTLRVAGKSVNTSRPAALTRGLRRVHASFDEEALAPGPHHYLVQFIGPIKKRWLSRIKKLGGDPRQPRDGYSYVVNCDAATLEAILAERFVRWAGHLPHKSRIRIAKGKDLPRTKKLDGRYEAEVFERVDLKKTAKTIQKLDIDVISMDDGGRTLVLEISGSTAERKAKMTQLSAVHGISALRERAIKRTSNDVAADIMGSAGSLAAPIGLSGKGEIVAVCDTGLDSGKADEIHEDFEDRVVAMKSYPIVSDYDDYIKNPGGDDGPSDVDSGHGTHVAGSVLGSGAASNNLPNQAAPIRGLAHGAELVFQAIEQELEWKKWQHEQEYGRYLLAGIPDDLEDLFAYARRKGARIHSNSWGGGDPGAYDAQSRQLDDYVWRHKDFCILVAAGNDGTDQNSDGTLDLTSVTSPATAKNCITVGASENVRANFPAAYGEWWPSDYPVAPPSTDPMADDPEHVAAFSSRGPTLEGRLKPEIVAPGTWILSTRSRRLAPNNFAWGAFPQSNLYFHMGGTSMATPLAAGAVAVLREFLRTWVGIESPSAAMMKACLIGGARRLPGYAPAGAVIDNHQGYGRVDVDAIVDPEDTRAAFFVDEERGLNTGEIETYPIKVTSKTVPLRVAMAYSDYPGADLVNDLNLVIVDPTGKRYTGNGAPGGPLTLDSTNNAEAVHVPQPARGDWRIEIIGSNVPQGRQPYALMVSGRVEM